MPKENIIKNNENNRKLNLPIYAILIEYNIIINQVNKLNYLKIKEDTLVIKDINQDRNCFFIESQ